MQEQDPKIPSGLQELESAIGSLRPASSGIEAAELMFQAGAASARRRKVFWPVLSALLAASLAVSLAYRPGTATTERIVYMPAEAPALVREIPTEPHEGASITSADGNYLKLRDDVLTRGLEALPEPPRGTSETSDTDLKGMMRLYKAGARGGGQM